MVDVVSCLPFGYVEYFSDGAADGNNLKSMKALRLMKLTKMLRLGRLKRILQRHGSDINYSQAFGIASTLSMILFLAHMLACFYYLVGEANQVLGNDVVVGGWVQSEVDWRVRHYAQLVSSMDDDDVTFVAPDQRISTRTKYITSLYYVLNALEYSHTSSERAFAVFAELIRDVILGLVAGMITTIVMTISNNDNEATIKIKNLKQWMRRKKLPKNFRVHAMRHFAERWGGDSSFDVTGLMQECTPAMAAHLADLLYGRFLATVPLFRGLSPEVISALCLRCKPISVVQGHIIIAQGEPGMEMYMIMQGEVEVSEKRTTGDPDHPFDIIRLGFLSEGAFFGEAPVLGREDTSLELRMRTVTAVRDSDLCFLTRQDIQGLYNAYPELKARMARFASAGRVLDEKSLRLIDLNRAEVQEFGKEYDKHVKLAKEVRQVRHCRLLTCVVFDCYCHGLGTKSRVRNFCSRAHDHYHDDDAGSQ